MILPSNSKSATKPSSRRWAPAHPGWTISIAFLTLACATSCALFKPRIVVIPEDRLIRFAPRGSTITLTNDTYLVPPARMLEILRALNSTNL
jgi:hypothetical protein